MAGDLRDELQATLGDSYNIERELGGGGMSRVFVAEETRLGRLVVIKLLHPDLAAGISAERFEREILVAARLQHPSIVPVLSVGEMRGLPYYMMPFVEGRSLRGRLSDGGALPIGEAIQILRDLARALEYAHRHGLVHRDIKPENILIAGDVAMLTDFGIAKAISASRTTTADNSLTREGTIVGTPLYMSPEQVTGDPHIDQRSDIYALGAMAYEMLTGVAPFANRSTHEILAAHVSETPPSARALRADTPVALADLVARCLEKDPARRPQNAREVLEALDTVASPSSMPRTPTTRISTRMVVLLAVVVVALVLGAVWAWRGGTRTAGGENGASVAVIPFINAAGDSAQDYFADGVSDELANAIGKLPGIRVAARSAAYRFRGRRDLDVVALGRDLGARYLVQGTVFRSGSRLKVSARLTDATTRQELWSDGYERDASDLFTVQDEISRKITAALRVRLALSAVEPAATRAQGTTDPDAYDFYLRGEFLLRRRSVPLAATNFERAIARDSGFARAHAGLSMALALFPYFAGVPAKSVAPRATMAARRALAFDTTLAVAHVAQGLVAMHALRWDEAGGEFAHAVALDPGDGEAHLQFGRYLLYRGRAAEAVEEWRRGRIADPYSAVISSWIALALAEMGKMPEALAETQRSLELDSTAAVVVETAAETFALAGDGQRARAEAMRIPDVPPWIGTKAYYVGHAGDRAAALAIVHRLERESPRPWFAETSIAAGYLGVMDTARALDALERATTAGEIWASYMGVGDVMYDPLRGSARWAALLRRVGLNDSTHLGR